MKFTPNYTVSYLGEFHRAGIPFEIKEQDAEEMSTHGIVEGYTNKTFEVMGDTEKETAAEEEAPAEEETITEEETEQMEDPEEEKPKRGRPAKENKNEAD